MLLLKFWFVQSDCRDTNSHYFKRSFFISLMAHHSCVLNSLRSFQVWSRSGPTQTTYHPKQQLTLCRATNPPRLYPQQQQLLLGSSTHPSSIMIFRCHLAQRQQRLFSPKTHDCHSPTSGRSPKAHECVYLSSACHFERRVVTLQCCRVAATQEGTNNKT